MKTLNDLQKGLLLNTTLKNYKNSGSALFLFSQFLFTISCSVCIFSRVLSQMYLVTAGKFLPSLILKVCSVRSGSIYTLLSLWRSIQCHWGGTGGGATEETRWRWKGNGGRTAQRSNCLLWYLFSQCVCDVVNWWKSSKMSVILILFFIISNSDSEPFL